MSNQSYLMTKLPALISERNNHYLRSYNLTRIKRYLFHTLVIFIFQYQAIINLPISSPALPFFPPMGIAFVAFYLLGSNALLGLIVAGFLAYSLKGLSAASILLYLIADVGCGSLGAILSQFIFSSDIKPFAKGREVIKFIQTNFFITCFLSSIFRFIALILHMKANLDASSDINLKVLCYNFLDLWLSDFNAVLILSGFLFSWVTVPFSREKISTKTIKKFPFILFIIGIVISLLLIKNLEMIYLYLLAMCLSGYMAYLYGYLIAMALLFIMSNLYLIYFIVQQQQFLMYFGLGLYTLVPVALLLYILCMLYLGHLRLLR